MDNIILTLDQRDMEPAVNIDNRNSYYIRQAVRVVLSDEAGRIALMHARQRDYYKLPGGGIDEGEDIKVALTRELLEETGSSAAITANIGTVLEWRDSEEMKQISHAFRATLVGEPGEPNFTQSELDEGFELIWANSVDEAIKLVESAASHRDLGVLFMTKRDAAILRAAN